MNLDSDRTHSNREVGAPGATPDFATMLFIVEKATSVAQWMFLMYFIVVGFNMYKLFAPPQCAVNDPAPHLCVPSAIGLNDKYDLWVWASPEQNFNAIAEYVKGKNHAAKTVHPKHEPGSALDPVGDDDGTNDDENDDFVAPLSLVHCAFGLRLNETLTANITVPVSKFNTRHAGTLYMHAVLYYPTLKSKSGAEYEATHENWRPSAPPLAIVSSAFTKTLQRRATNYTMLLGEFKEDIRADIDASSDETIYENQASAAIPDGDKSESQSTTCDAADRTEEGTCAAASSDASKSAVTVEMNTEFTDSTPGKLVHHLRPRLTFFVVSKPPTFDRRKGMPGDLPIKVVRANDQLMKKGHKMAYAPLVLCDDVAVPRREYIELSSDTTKADPVITLKVSPMHVGLFRLTHQMTTSLKMLSETFGMTESDLDDVKELFTGHDWRWMAATFAVSLLHSWFAFLAFKHDVGFWKKKSNLEGLSVRTQWSTLVCQSVIFFNLLDTGQASTIILCEMGISTAIEAWKVSKFMARDGVFYRLFKVGKAPKEKTQVQIDTDVYDKRAMFYLSLCLYPIVLVYGGYSLIYQPQRSWRSWILRTLANGVYMFGFIAMTPQLYVNYRLKSVAHMPWRAFMYKTFNTFIDDVFAFAVTMPLIHRIACLRDDLVFFVYLYQRRIYPVDKKRVNEFGRAYEEGEDHKSDENDSKSDTNSDKKDTKSDTKGDKSVASKKTESEKKR